MAIKITDEVIKKYTEREGLPEVYEAYKGIKSSNDLKKFMRDPLNKRTVEAIEIEQKRDKKIDALNKLREDPLYEGATDEELVELAPETFADIEGDKAEVQFGIPTNLFPPKGEMSNREWLAIIRENFRKAGLDFDNPEDRRRAAEAQSLEEGRDQIKESVKEEGLRASLGVPRSLERMRRGEQIGGVDVASDLLRIAEAAPPIVAVPAIVGRNVIEGVADENNPQEVVGNIAADIGMYAGGGLLGSGVGRGINVVRGPLRKFLGGQRVGESTLPSMLRKTGEGSRGQVVKAMQKALLGERAGITNPYAESTAEIVEKAGLSEPQKKKAQGILEKYLKDRDMSKVAEQAETAMQKRELRGRSALEKEIKAEAKNIGRETTGSTMSKKLDWDGVKEFLPSSNANELITKLQSAGLRDKEGNVIYTGVSDYSSNTIEVARKAKESRIIADYLDSHKRLRNTMFRGLAQEKVLAGYGVAPDPKLRGIFRYVAETPVAYEMFTSAPAARLAGKKGVQSLSRYAGPRINVINGTYEDK